MEYQDRFRGFLRIGQPREWLGWFRCSGSLNRFLCFLFFITALALFFHMREERVAFVEPNTKSTRYVIAQTAFYFADEDATQILRQQAMRDVGEIYKFDELQLQNSKTSFSRFLIEDDEWRHKASIRRLKRCSRGLKR
jgi:hypothetical protein